MTVMTSGLTQAPLQFPTLDVLEGRHQGVNLVLTQQTYAIGSDAADQLVLGDAGVAAHHLTLRLDGARVHLEARGEEIRLEQRGHTRLLARGTGYRASLPVILQIGEARLRLSGPSQPAAPVPVWYGRPQWLIAVLFMGLCAGAVAMLQPVGERLPLASQAAESIPRAGQHMTLDQARADLQQQAKASGLQGLAVAIQGQGLRVAGSILPAQREAWQALQRHFDAHYARQFVLHGDVRVSPPTPRPLLNIQAAWFGTNPYVIDATGERLYPGSMLDGGWRIERIAEQRIQLVHDRERFDLTLATSED